MANINIKRIYEPQAVSDGYRMLIDRLWPRGVAKADAGIHEWNKDIAPSAELRKWFNHCADRFEAFGHAYKMELEKKSDELKRLKAISEEQNLTLLYAAKDVKINHAQVLLDILNGIK